MTAPAEAYPYEDNDGRELDRHVGMQAGRGDVEVFGQIYELYSDRLRYAMQRSFRGHPPAEDIVQDAMVSALEAIEKGSFTYRGPNSMYNWLSRIAVNKGINFIRHNKVIAQVPVDFQEAAYMHPVTGDFAESVVDNIVGEELAETLLGATNPDFADAVWEVDVRGLNHREYAESRGMPIGTAQSRVHRGRQAMRNILEAQESTE